MDGKICALKEHCCIFYSFVFLDLIVELGPFDFCETKERLKLEMY